MSEAFIDHFGSVSGAYAHFRPTYPPPLFDWLAAVAPARQRAWDCATGTGQAAVALAAHFSEVVASDASAAQLEAASPHPRVHYRLAAAEGSGLEAGSIDLVTVAQALHWFDRPRFFAEVARVLRPGGVLAVWSYGIPHLDGEATDALLQHFYGDIVGPYWPAEKAQVETGYRDLVLPFAALPAPSFAMEAAWSLEQLLGYGSSWSASARYRAALGSDPIDWLRPALAAVWGKAQTPRRLHWPLTIKASRLGSP
ncbi:MULTISPECIES: class I SAM-dependent methyltransferase [unclassified Cyanobium]|uniref:class I SAM-dependent methyltransferase n=1 Tax=unclassified Cyanobium TaxID=2627006 RepID=UPI0020CD31E6|nr:MULTISPECIES: class I SAM-dependent methyltransferase [unclassified Cyanobium]MCP9833767.1 class I SAM-dependent methyltransferase [Cyanobium sp. La Preciosa 7G6]MCP9936475.1 class I SAM-dependent methyltransferase [Cyanobium sp. Aljojuca 7A6]